MKTVAEMQEYIRTRSDRELLAEYEIYQATYRAGLADVFTELLAIEIDSRELKGKE